MENTTTNHWTFLGSSKPSWSLALGWGAIYALIPAWFVCANILRWTPYAGWFGFIAGIFALAMAIKHKSGLLMSFAFIEMFSYLIIVVIAGVNTP